MRAPLAGWQATTLGNNGFFDGPSLVRQPQTTRRMPLLTLSPAKNAMDGRRVRRVGHLGPGALTTHAAEQGT